jgi:hypothetical protein
MRKIGRETVRKRERERERGIRKKDIERKKVIELKEVIRLLQVTSATWNDLDWLVLNFAQGNLDLKA